MSPWILVTKRNGSEALAVVSSLLLFFLCARGTGNLWEQVMLYNYGNCYWTSNPRPFLWFLHDTLSHKLPSINLHLLKLFKGPSFFPNNFSLIKENIPINIRILPGLHRLLLYGLSKGLQRINGKYVSKNYKCVSSFLHNSSSFNLILHKLLKFPCILYNLLHISVQSVFQILIPASNLSGITWTMHDLCIR